jgi:hypothetical protein
MGWGKIGGLCSLKAIALACFLTPTTATVLPVTPAYAQFSIIIPGFGGYRGRRYGRRHARSPRRGRGGEPGEVSATPSATPSAVPSATPGGSASVSPPSGGSGGKKIRGTAD